MGWRNWNYAYGITATTNAWTANDLKAKYDETGYIGGEKNSWPVGDSVYVVPYYAKISKQVEQTNKDERKSVYTLDNGERYVPSFYWKNIR